MSHPLSRKTFLLLAISTLLLVSGCQSVSTGTTAADIEHLNPPTMVDTSSFGYSQVVTASGGKLIFIAGQGPTNPDEKSAGKDDLQGQARQAVDNILRALDAAGAGPENIVYLRINIVDYNPRKMLDIAPEIERLKGKDMPPPASVLIGVESLILPSTLIEIEAIAAL